MARIGYARVSTIDQDLSTLSCEAEGRRDRSLRTGCTGQEQCHRSNGGAEEIVGPGGGSEKGRTVIGSGEAEA